MTHILENINNIVKKFPKKIAIEVNEKDFITYIDLWNKSQAVALHLEEMGIPIGSIIEINMKKSIDYIIAIIGVWMHGSAFIPIPLGTPLERAKYIRTDIEPDYVLTHKTKIKPFQKKYHQTRNKESLAYIFYTSGSTGRPKGVRVLHTGIPYVITEQMEIFKINKESRSLFFLSISFDASLSDILTTLCSGATLCIEDVNPLELSENIVEILIKRNISHIDIPPSLLSIIPLSVFPKNIKTIIIGGERISIDVIKSYAKLFHVVNVYGPTEATICSSYIICEPENWTGQNIGFPIHKTKYHIYDESGKIVNTLNSPGELYISGPQVAEKYHNLPKLNKQKFININNEKYYKTGDIVSRKKDGYYFIGRNDRQVKIRGQLVALEEIELTFISENSVLQAACIFQEENKKLILFLEITKKYNSSILSHILEKIPSYMNPNHIIILEKMPTYSNNKVNYTELKNPEKNNNRKKYNYEPDQESSYILLKIWKEVLNIENINFDDNFFTLGGTSLDILEIVMKSKKYNINISINTLANNPTIKKLEHFISQNSVMLSDADFVTNLENKVLLSKNIKKIFKENKPRPYSKGEIFITGANGFLGIYTVKELLKNTSTLIHLLIRASTKKEALERIKISAKKYNIKITNKDYKRIHIYIGDISLDRLGLNEKDWNYLSTNISNIYHLAAEVNMVKTYEQLEKVNVTSIFNIIELSYTHRLKKINFASSLSVFVASDENNGVLMENKDLLSLKKIYGGYAQTKWVIERILDKYVSKIIPINIFRFGLLTGDSNSGITSKHDYINMFTKSLILLNQVPKGNHVSLKIDITPVNYASECFVEISENSDSGIYHISTNKYFTLHDIIIFLKKGGHHINLVDSFLFQKGLKDIDQTILASTSLMAICRLYDKKTFEQLRGMDLFQSTNVNFDNTNARKYTQNIEKPIINQKLLEKYLNKTIEK